MNENYTTHKRIFEHHLLEGTHYEIGWKQGEILKNKERELNFYTSGKFNKKKSKFKSFQEILDFYDSYCPGLREECLGFADSLGVKEENLSIYDFPISMEKGCSHLAVLPSLTEKNEILVGRSYEWNFRDEDLEFRTTKVSGKYKHLGFAGMIFGRYDGINENGLCVTYSAGGAWNAKFHKKGLSWALAVRVLLDSCKNTEEAINTLVQIPVDWSSNFIIIDKKAKGALVESIDSDYEIIRFDENSEKQYIVATNHFVLPSKVEFNKYNNPWLLPNSKKRREIIEIFIEKNAGKITEKSLEKLQSSEFPEGLCCHWQSDGFGTDWSMIFNVTTGKVRSCFGPPSHNPWYDFNLEDEVVKSKYDVTFIDKKIF